MIHLVSSPEYWQLVRDAHSWRELARESAPVVFYLALLLFVVCFALAAALVLLRSETRDRRIARQERDFFDKENRDLNTALDHVIHERDDAVRANDILCKENDRLRGLK